MRLLTSSAIVVSLLASAPLARAQAAVNPAGHWEGAIDAPGMNVNFQIDVAKDAKGGFAGAISIPGEHIKGLPLARFDVDGKTIVFGARSDQLLSGTISDDGNSISGTYSIQAMAVPFTITRTGDAKIEPPVVSKAIAKAFEGTWNGTLDVDGGLRLVLTLANQPDGTSIGYIVNLDEGGLRIPLLIAHDDANLTLTSAVTGGKFEAAMNGDGTELVGTYTQGSTSVPLTFRRAR
jgi:hypothetical protein